MVAERPPYVVPSSPALVLHTQKAPKSPPSYPLCVGKNKVQVQHPNVRMA
jgi:hypothetical protein